MARIRLVDLCGARCGDKGDMSDVTLFCDDEAAYEAVLAAVTPEVVAGHFGDLVRGPVERFEARNVLAVKFVLHDALGGGAPRSLRSDNLGKTFSAALLRLEIDVPESRRYGRPPAGAGPAPAPSAQREGHAGLGCADARRAVGRQGGRVVGLRADPHAVAAALGGESGQAATRARPMPRRR